MNKYLNMEKANLFRIPSIVVFCTYIILILGKMLEFNRPSMIITIIVILLGALISIRPIRINYIMIAFILFIAYNSLLCLVFPNNKSLYFLIIQIISLSIIVILSVISINKEYLNNITRHFSNFYFYFIIIFLIAYLSGKVNMTDDSFMLGIYQAIFAMTYFVLLRLKKTIPLVLICASMPFLSGERGLAICIIIAFFMYYLITAIRKNRVMYTLCFLATSIGVTMYQFVYVSLSKSQIGSVMNEISRIYTEQNFFSGRQIIWGAVNDYILESPIIGYGLGNNVLASNNIFMSAHNTYVDILLSGGIISILFYFNFLYSIWTYFFKYLDNEAVRLSASFLIAIMFFGVNGVIIVGNDINFTLYLWLVVGMGIMVTNGIKNNVFE